MQVLLTNRLTLRPPALPDAEEIALHLNNFSVARMLGPVPFPFWPADAEDWIAGLTAKPKGMVYTIHRERLIGAVSIEGGGDEPRLGYWLGEPWHGHGFMTEAARALLVNAFATRGMKAVSSYLFTDNHASLRVQEKLGFKVTGPGEAWCQSRGATVDTLQTRLTASAFANAQDPGARTAA